MPAALATALIEPDPPQTRGSEAPEHHGSVEKLHLHAPHGTEPPIADLHLHGIPDVQTPPKMPRDITTDGEGWSPDTKPPTLQRKDGDVPAFGADEGQLSFSQLIGVASQDAATGDSSCCEPKAKEVEPAELLWQTGFRKVRFAEPPVACRESPAGPAADVDDNV